MDAEPLSPMLTCAPEAFVKKISMPIGLIAEFASFRFQKKFALSQMFCLD